MKHNRAFLLLSIALILIITASFLSFKPTIPSVSAIVAEGSIGVYWDQACTQNVTSISWGSLSLGQTQEVIVYVLNEGNETGNETAIVPYVTTLNWQPLNASNWLTFAWVRESTSVAVGQVDRVALTLKVNSDFPGGFSNFSFSIEFFGEDHLLGDVNRDGIVNMVDLAIVAKAFGSRPGDPRWNPEADVNGDGVVDMRDLAIVAADFGKTGPR